MDHTRVPFGSQMKTHSEHSPSSVRCICRRVTDSRQPPLKGRTASRLRYSAASHRACTLRASGPAVAEPSGRKSKITTERFLATRRWAKPRQNGCAPALRPASRRREQCTRLGRHALPKHRRDQRRSGRVNRRLREPQRYAGASRPTMRRTRGCLLPTSHWDSRVGRNRLRGRSSPFLSQGKRPGMIARVGQAGGHRGPPGSQFAALLAGRG